MQKRIMIVEDEGLIANDIANQLKKGGYQIAAISSSGEDALAILPASAPDLVLMDIRLKGKIDGIEAASRVRSEYKLPIIFLTSHADTETLARAKQSEPYGYLVKPFRSLSLLTAIEMGLSKHKSDLALMEREAWLTTVLQATAAPTLVTDVNGAIQFLNGGAEQLLHCKLPDVAGLQWNHVALLFEQTSNAPVGDLVTAALERATAVKLPPGIVLRNGPGPDRPVEGEIAPSFTREKPAGAIVTLRDVSERIQEEAEARQNQKMLALGRLAGAIAHDINNLLTIIIGQGTLLAEGMPEPERLASINAILIAAHRAAKTGAQLLTLGRKQVLTTEVLDVNGCINHAAQAIIPSLGPGVRLSMNLDSGAGAVRMNAAQFDQVLLNLALNARDAMPKGGTIRIATSTVDRAATNPHAEKADTFVRITIADSGDGILPEIREHLFEPFFTTKPFGQGTGLGLAIVYGAVKDAGGEIAVQSPPGGGAVFELLVPRVEESPSPRNVQPRDTPVFDVAKKIVLLVDDEELIREMVGKYLQKNGFEVLIAADGQEALELADQYDGTINVLVSDVLMPRMDGVTLSLRLGEGRPGMKVLFISGHPGNKIDGLKNAGPPLEFLSKPFLLPTLLAKIQELAS